MPLEIDLNRAAEEAGLGEEIAKQAEYSELLFAREIFYSKIKYHMIQAIERAMHVNQSTEIDLCKNLLGISSIERLRQIITNPDQLDLEELSDFFFKLDYTISFEVRARQQ